MKNWRTTLSGIATAIFGVIAALAVAPYQLGSVAEIIPPEWKAELFKWCGICAVISFVIKSAFTADTKEIKPPEADPKKTTRFWPMIAFLGFSTVLLTSCASDPYRPPVNIRVPIGKEGSLGSLILATGYMPPIGTPDFRLWPVTGMPVTPK